MYKRVTKYTKAEDKNQTSMVEMMLQQPNIHRKQYRNHTKNLKSIQKDKGKSTINKNKKRAQG